MQILFALTPIPPFLCACCPPSCWSDLIPEGALKAKGLADSPGTARFCADDPRLCVISVSSLSSAYDSKCPVEVLMLME
ncbi:hypothetical protein AVEN_83118-1 [Araneus ventricosus]|uniref:Secreted protein n=1 Tax=Araneus ventricosus TaxID=182803 RepID=A0A4Y2AP49_ARAVE|nr:hypothetical protein AVEN_83118-1 [Araneus ventricosus]